MPAICKPFVKVFKTPELFYLFDVNTDLIQEISRGLYEYIQSDMDEKFRTETVIKELNGLMDQGMVSINRPEKVGFIDDNYISYQINNKMSQLVLQVTQSCNLVCGYCPYANKTEQPLQRDHTGKVMSFETARRAVDFLYEHSSDMNSVNISFYGGEPLLNMDLIEKVVAYADRVFLGKTLHYNMTTNATLLDERNIDFIVKHGISVMVSLDGPKQIHNKNRKKIDGSGSFEETFRGLIALKQRYGKDYVSKLSISMVNDPRNDPDEVVGFLQKEEIRNITVVMSALDDSMLDQKVVADSVFIEKYNYWMFLAYLDFLDIISDLTIPAFVSTYFMTLEEDYMKAHQRKIKLDKAVIPSGPCIPVKHKLFVSVDGTFYPCERVNEISDVMKIGNIDYGIEYEKLVSLCNLGVLSEESCRDCWAVRHCTLCCRDADGRSCLSSEEKMRHCMRSKRDAFSALRDYALIREVRTHYIF